VVAGAPAGAATPVWSIGRLLAALLVPPNSSETSSEVNG
jgi:hypothetical protein